MSPDTIFAVATGPGRAAIAIVRLSGPSAGSVVMALSGAELPEPRRAVLRRFRDPATDDLLDEGLVLWLPAPSSFTGEDQAEFHIHGGLAVRAAFLAALRGMRGCRPAEPGEFTRRAFQNGRLDLTRVEGLADLIDAETDAQRRQALRQQAGALTAKVAEWREKLIDVLAQFESALDFADEDDVPEAVASSGLADVARLEAEIQAALAGGGRGERVREGYTVVIAGAANAGKSTLLNAIAKRDVAIVSSLPGTTRDAVEVRCDLDGLPVTFIDTAGLRESADPVEQEGIRRSLARIATADLVLWAEAADAPAEGGPARPDERPVLQVTTKLDLLDAEPSAAPLGVSALSGQGMDWLLARVVGLLGGGSDEGGDVLITRERHRWALATALNHLARAQVSGQDGRVELVAEDVRLALRAFGSVMGYVDVEDVLDRVFAQFCIGK